MNPSDGCVSFIINPGSGASSSKQVTHRFCCYLESKGFGVRLNYTRSLKNAAELGLESAVDPECGLVVAVGGDGTIREVAHGMEGAEKPLLLIPGGTENLLANELGLDENFAVIARTFDAGFVRPLDMGRINGRCFTSIAGFGFDGEVVQKVNAGRDGNIDHFDYFWPLWSTFWTFRFKHFKVEIDGEIVFDDYGLVFVGNISRYAVGLEILKFADYSDGELDVCIYKCSSRPGLFKHSLMTLLKSHAGGRDVIYRRGSKIVVSSRSSDVLSQVDGDPGPALPAEIEMLSGAVNVMVPEKGHPAGIRSRIRRLFR